MTPLLAVVSITIGGIIAEPGTAVSRMVSIPGAAEIPVSVVHGGEAGPVVALQKSSMSSRLRRFPRVSQAMIGTPRR